MSLIFGVDIGGTSIKLGIFDENLKIIKKWSVKTELRDSGKQIIPSIANEIIDYINRNNLSTHDITGIGLGIPGPVDSSGYVRNCVNLNWNDFHPVKALKQLFPEAVITAGNDANVAALGEYTMGAGKHYNSIMLITLGTGVGGGIIIDGNIIAGASGLAGEIGHINVGPKDRGYCNCGNCGCVDYFASATGIVREMKRMLSFRNEECKLRGVDEFSAKDVCEAAAEGDKLCNECLELCLGVLGKAMVYFAHAFDPDVFVIGGGLSKAGDLVISAIMKEYKKNFFLIDKPDNVITATLGNDAGMTGAAALVKSCL